MFGKEQNTLLPVAPCAQSNPNPPVCIFYDSVHQVIVHQLEGTNVGGPQIQVDLVLLAHALQVMRVRHPRQLVDDLGVPARLCGQVV